MSPVLSSMRLIQVMVEEHYSSFNSVLNIKYTIKPTHLHQDANNVTTTDCEDMNLHACTNIFNSNKKEKKVSANDCNASNSL